jgi:hypothetical protein
VREDGRCQCDGEESDECERTWKEVGLEVIEGFDVSGNSGSVDFKAAERLLGNRRGT